MHRILSLLALAALLLAGTACDQKPSKVKIGFVVKQPEDNWFQNEWKFAHKAADQYGFELITVGASSDERVMTAIDTLAAQHADGMIICTPNTRLGPAIVRKAASANLKLMSVDDQFIGTDGKFMDVHHMGISARDIGKVVGQTLAEEMKKRGWKPEETGAAIMTFEQLDTARERTDGAIEALTKAGFPQDRIFKQPHKTDDTPGAFDAANALLTTKPEIKRWIVAGMNDGVVLGAVRAMEGRQFNSDSIIGIGINGDTALGEFQKEKVTGFFGSVLLSPKRHGFETAENMYKWIKEGKEPAKATYTSGILITRANYKQVLKEQGLAD